MPPRHPGSRFVTLQAMRAYKFLDGTGRAVFSGFRWLGPGPGDEAGPWIETDAVVPCREGVHGCRPSAVAFWLNEDLWEVDLAGEIVDVGTKIVAGRGRLRRRSRRLRRHRFPGRLGGRRLRREGLAVGLDHRPLRFDLAVVAREVGDAGDGRAAESGVPAVMVVAV